MNINVIILICVYSCSLFPLFFLQKLGDLRLSSFLIPISGFCISGKDYNQVFDEKNKAVITISLLHLVKKADIRILRNA
jgi:hypothetical protein